MRNPAGKKQSPLLKLAFLGFTVPLCLASLPALSQSSPSVSPTASQAVTPQPNLSNESKKPGESKSVDEEKQERSLIFWAGGIGVVASGYFLVLWLRPRWLLLIPSNFKIPRLGPLPEISPSILHFFQYRPRVLDAWIDDRIEKAREAFECRTTVEERKIHVVMPVVLEGKTVTELTAKDLKKTCSKQEFRLLISGEGGAGKTHLACQIAKWAMAEKVEERLCNHQMLPVLIEEELEDAKDKPSDISSLLDAITRQLKSLRDEERPIPEELLKKLLEKRRVLVIVDHLSEMSEATRKAIRFKDASFPVNALVVATRLEDLLGKEVKPTLLKPMRVNGKQLSIFMDDYLKAKGKRDLFEDDKYFEYLGRLSQIVPDAREITLLFAKLYADLMIAIEEGHLPGDPPKNVPDLMLSYVSEVNSNREESELDDAIVKRDLKMIAWECVQTKFKPGEADCQQIFIKLSVLEGEGEAAKETAKQHLKYLEKRLALIRTDRFTNQRLRISLDPLAEYLVGLYLVEHYGNDEEAWRSFLTEAAEKPSTLGEIRGFLLAVRDCCLVKGAETKVPDFVAEELGRLAGLDLEGLRQEQLKQRISRLICDLDVPEAEDKIHAIEQLGKIGPVAKVASTPIIRLLKDTNPGVRSSAVDALGQLGDRSEEILRGLRGLLNDENTDSHMRSKAAHALGQLGDDSEEVLQHLASLLNDETVFSNLRFEAAQALSLLGGNTETVLRGLLSLLNDETVSSDLRSKVAGALGRLGNNSEVVRQSLLSLLNDENIYSDLRFEAAHTLGLLGSSSEAVQSLLSLLNNKNANSDSRFEASQALIKLGNNSEAVLQSLRSLLNDEEKIDLYARSTIAIELVKLNCVTEDVLAVLEIASQEKASPLQEDARKALDRVAKQGSVETD